MLGQSTRYRGKLESLGFVEVYELEGTEWKARPECPGPRRLASVLRIPGVESTRHPSEFGRVVVSVSDRSDRSSGRSDRLSPEEKREEKKKSEEARLEAAGL